MIKKIIIYLVGAALFIVAVGIFLQKSSTFNPKVTPTPTGISSPSVTIGSKEIDVTLARTPQDREKGLGGVSTLDSESGMLFVFEKPENPQVFWMKGMLIPIDIIWIRDGKIVKIDKNVPVPAQNTPDNKLKTYSAGQIVDYVLEVNAGFSDKNSIKTGGLVTFLGI